MSTKPNKSIETFENPYPGRNYHIYMECPEFTCLCPLTGQPDFATIKIDYVPDKLCVELKSLKLYLWGFREEGGFHEKVTNEIMDHLVEKTNPRFMEIKAEFATRGGIDTTITVTHKKD